MLEKKIKEIHRYVPQDTRSLSQQGIISKQISNKTPAELRYIERSVSMKEVNNQNLWNFELSCQGIMNLPIYTFIGFQQRDRQDSQNLNYDAFCRLPVTSALCNVGTKKGPDDGILLNYEDDDYSQSRGQIKEVFRASTKDDILQRYISLDNFRSLKVRVDDDGYILYVFDLRYQQIFTAPQPFKVEFKFDGVVPDEVNG